ncbi:EAL domain-containing protein [Undibacterium sp. TC9W]|uniref:EAL domain-containing protein n=1 Tax=Undibacterium sp. TC9W TaxID=3413053 RepID=UPI003BF04811
MDTATVTQIDIANELQLAINTNQLQLHYQPKADLQTGLLVGMEALLRWNHAKWGAVSPSLFIPVAEKNELIIQLGDWVIRQACLDIISWSKANLVSPCVAINISPIQLQDPDFIGRMSSILQTMQVRPEQISIEITEGILIDHDSGMKQLLDNFKLQGYRLSLDDFGTGYSALSYLKHFPFDFVKIDQSFVRDLPDNSDDISISKAIIAMAHSMGLKVIAEGVETEAQCKFLSENMCDQIQGYFFSPPLSFTQMTALLNNCPALEKHLLRIARPDRTLLLVDDEPNILSSLKRLLRRDGYQILTAGSGSEGLEILKNIAVDVIISDQRMPSMTGVEFLRNAKELYPNTIRMVLSGYTELQYITDAINEGAIYKFLTKPWDDELIRAHIAEAFQYKEMADENQSLNLQIKTKNQELIAANRRLSEIVRQKQRQITINEMSLSIVREVLQYVPFPIIAVDDENMVVFLNNTAEEVLPESKIELGCQIEHLIPGVDSGIKEHTEGLWFPVYVYQKSFKAQWKNMGRRSQPSGKIVMLIDDRKCH